MGGAERLSLNRGSGYLRPSGKMYTTLACTAMDGTAPPTITLASVVTNDLIPMVDDLSGGSMAVLYTNSGGTGQAFALEAFNIQTCTGGTGAGQCQVAGTPTWSARVTTASTFYPEHSSSVSIGTTVYFAGANSTAEGTWSFPLGGAAPKTYQIDATVNGDYRPCRCSGRRHGECAGNRKYTGRVLRLWNNHVLCNEHYRHFLDPSDSFDL